MRPAGLLWLLLGGLAAALVILIARQHQETVFGLPHERFAQLVLLGSILAALAFGLNARGAVGRAFRHGIGWLAVFALLIAVYSYRTEFEWIARRMVAELFPGEAVVEEVEGRGEQVIVNRTLGGHFRLAARINGARVAMLVDTGASVVTLTAADAARAGFDVSRLRFSVPVMTANGSAAAAPVVLDRLEVGPIERRRVPALVARPGMLDQSLLGMSFLDSLSGFAVAGDRLTLSP